ncbi:alpha-ketoglutarate-dependent sulfonate dioxygenase [Xylogone sp. PMI_703]|nr:alpha-ketoglutarate-dependent sulfonate dioxygenase [Xylogone sp. PMI_703]
MYKLRSSSKFLRLGQRTLVRHATSSTRGDHPVINSSNLHALKVINPDSGMPTTVSPLFNPNIVGRVPPEPNRPEIDIPKDRGCYADPEKKALLAVAEPVDLTISVGTELKGCQLSRLNHKQLDELALLIAERGVVFLRNQDITSDQQAEMFEYFGPLEKHPGQKGGKYFHLPPMSEIHERSDLNHSPWPGVDWHSDTSFEINPPCFTMLRMETHPTVGGDTAWTSSYGLYDELSPAMKKIVEGLHAVHTSRHMYETMCDMWLQTPNRPPMDSHHPAVITHPVTGLKALNINIGWCDGFAELNKAESDALMNFFRWHIHSADDHYVRWKWEPGSVAIWDNRCVLHRIIPSKYRGPLRTGIRTVTKGAKPVFDPNSLGRREKEELEEKRSKISK